jgi:hypothetical protein
MLTRTRSLALAALAALLAHDAGAQSLSTFGGAELAGLGEGSAILGVGLSTGRNGITPIAGLNVQTYKYRSGTELRQNSAIVPSIGLQYKGNTGNVQATVGYNFTNRDVGGTVPIFGAIGGGDRSTVLGAQANYWGGIYEHQAIVSYNINGQYTWSRFRAAARPVATTPLYLGGQLGWQGTPKFDGVYRTQVGPTINYHFTPNFHLGGSAGALFRNGNRPTTGYLGVEFLVLTPLGG